MPDPVQTSAEMSAESFVAALRAHGSPVDVDKNRRHFRTSSDFLGVRMGQVFALARQYVDLPPSEIDKVLDSSIHEVRVGAVSITGLGRCAGGGRRRSSRSARRGCGGRRR